MKQNPPTRFRFFLTVFTFYFVTSIAALLLGTLQPTLRIPDVVIQIAQFGPAVGVLATLVLFRDARQYLAHSFSIAPYVQKRIIAAIGIAATIFILSIIGFIITRNIIEYTNPLKLSYPFWIIFIAQFIGAAGEELGWRAFLQPYLQSRLRVLTSSIVVGLLWAFWHVGVFAEGALYSSLFVLSAVSLSVIVGELLRRAQGNNLVIATVFHASVNLGLLMLFNEEQGSVTAMSIVAISCAAMAILSILHSYYQRSLDKL